MFDDVQKHSEKVTINITRDDYDKFLSLADEIGEPVAVVVKKAFSKMRG